MNTVCPHNCKDCFAMRVCAIGAISEKEETINIDSDLCIGCGSCKTACNTFGYKALNGKSKRKLMGS